MNSLKCFFLFETKNYLELLPYGVAFMLAIFFGIMTVYVFNHIPAQWLCDYNEEPHTFMCGIRLNNQWWLCYSAFFFASILIMTFHTPVFSSSITISQRFLFLIYTFLQVTILWLFVQIAIADRKYLIIPDQYLIAILLLAMILLLLHYFTAGSETEPEWMGAGGDCLSALKGFFIGGGLLYAISLLGKWLFRQEVIGFGDVKLSAVTGFSLGVENLSRVLLIACFAAAFVFSLLLWLKKIRKEQEQPLAPFIVLGVVSVILLP